MSRRKSSLVSISLVLCCFAMAGCAEDNSAREADADKKTTTTTTGTSDQLTLSVSSSTVQPGGNVYLSASGGQSPYSYALYSGYGSVSGNYYYASSTDNTSAYVVVQDANGSRAYQQIYTSSSSSSSSTVNATVDDTTIGINESVRISVSGGTSPYTASITSGSGSLSGSYYYAPSYSTTATIKVTDSNGYYDTITIYVDSANSGSCITQSIGSVKLTSNTYTVVSCTNSSYPYIDFDSLEQDDFTCHSTRNIYGYSSGTDSSSSTNTLPLVDRVARLGVNALTSVQVDCYPLFQYLSYFYYKHYIYDGDMTLTGNLRCCSQQ